MSMWKKLEREENQNRVKETLEVEVDEHDVEIEQVGHRVEAEEQIDRVLVRSDRGKRQRQTRERIRLRRSGSTTKKKDEDAHECVRTWTITIWMSQPTGTHHAQNVKCYVLSHQGRDKPVHI